jgi:hypothetical protein
VPGPTPLETLLDLRRRYPSIQLTWDRQEGRPVARPASVLRTRPDIVAALAEAKPQIGSLLQWEVDHEPIVVTPAQLACLQWLRVCGPAFWATGWQLWPWIDPITDPVRVVETLLIETARGPANPGWDRALKDVERLMQLEREGQL